MWDDDGELLLHFYYRNVALWRRSNNMWALPLRRLAKYSQSGEKNGNFYNINWPRAADIPHKWRDGCTSIPNWDTRNLRKGKEIKY